MEIIKSIDWAIDTIRNNHMFGLEGHPLAAAKSRELRAKGVLLDCKEELQSLKDQLEKAEKVINIVGAENECEIKEYGSCEHSAKIKTYIDNYFQEKQEQLKGEK